MSCDIDHHNPAFPFFIFGYFFPSAENCTSFTHAKPCYRSGCKWISAPYAACLKMSGIIQKRFGEDASDLRKLERRFRILTVACWWIGYCWCTVLNPLALFARMLAVRRSYMYANVLAMPPRCRRTPCWQHTSQVIPRYCRSDSRGKTCGGCRHIGGV